MPGSVYAIKVPGDAMNPHRIVSCDSRRRIPALLLYYLVFSVTRAGLM